MEVLWREMRLACRTLMRSPGFTAVIVLTLALGIGATTGVFGVVQAVLLDSVPYPEPDRLVFGVLSFKGGRTGLSAHDFFDYRDQAVSFDSLSAQLPFSTAVASSGGDRPENVTMTYVSTDLFHTLGVSPILGRQFSAQEGMPAPVVPPSQAQPLPPVAIVSHAYWQRRFGASPAAVGQTISLRGEPVSVVGVMPQGFRFFVDTDVWMPLRLNGERATHRRFHNWVVVGRLKPGVTLAQAQAEVTTIAERLEQLYPDSNTDMRLQLTGLHEALVRRLRPQVLLITAAVALMLLIACGNIANLMLARGVGRRSEIAMRVALGGSRRRVAGHLVTESVMLAIVGGVLGLGVAALLQRLLVTLLGLGAGPLGDRHLALDMRALAFAFVVSLLTGLAVGIVPALRATRIAPFEELKGATRTATSRGGARLRMALVLFQVALSLVLLLGSALLVRSFARLVRSNLGFDPENVVTARIAVPPATSDGAAVQFFEEVLAEVRAVPGVTSAGLVDRLPVLQGGSSVEVWTPERPSERSFSRQALARVVLPGYFEAMRMPLVAGRDVSDTDRTGTPPVLIVNQTMSRTLFSGENPVGRRVLVDLGDSQPATLEVAGVVADARLGPLDDGPQMAMYFPHAQITQSGMQIVIRTASDPQGITNALREIVWSRNKEIPVEELQMFASAIRRSTLPQQTLTGTVTSFSLFALLLACVGLFGVLAYQVTQRRHEIGIRLALGAGRGHILTTVLGQGLAVTAGGMVAGALVGLALARLLSSMLYEVSPSDPMSLLAATACLLLAALVACLVPAARALRIEPNRALRYE